MTFNIGAALIQLRKHSGLTQQEVADRLYVSRQTYSGWEHNECDLSLSKLADVAAIHQIQAEELFRLIIVFSSDIR